MTLFLILVGIVIVAMLVAVALDVILEFTDNDLEDVE